MKQITRIALTVSAVIAVSGFVNTGAAEEKETARKNWYETESPMLAVMTGFIYEPLQPYTIEEWAEELGSNMDADQWVADFKAAGATYLIFYDKWIDGFVFHDTKTTAFKTKRDFVREIVDACHRGGLRIVFYYNALNDGNPEYFEWALDDRAGKPIVFSPNWPTRYQTLHSPFRKHSIEQARELLTNYGRIDGMWLDIFGERLNTNSRWTAQGYETMFDEPFAQASGTRLAEFNARTLAAYLDDVRAIGARTQPDLVWTSNGAGRQTFQSGVWAKWVGSRLDYGSDEGHHFRNNDRLARMAWVLDMPTEVGLLLCKSWFSPLGEDVAPASMTRREAISAAAIGVCQGASVYMALTPDHSGTFGEDLDRAKAVGGWFKKVEPVLKGAQPYADVGIVLGAPDSDGPGLGTHNRLWKRYTGQRLGLSDQAFAVEDALERAGVFGHVLLATERGGSWPESLDGFRAVILPERAPLDKHHCDQLRRYVKQGGRLIAFGHASTVDAMGVRQPKYALADLFGVQHKGEYAFAKPSNLATVKTDSVYVSGSENYLAENLLDGSPSFWASDGTPMPHWAEIELGTPADVARVEVLNRSGPYQILDLDIEVFDHQGWTLVASVRDATTRLISVPFDTPVRTDKLRVKILREHYQGKDRQWADVEAIHVIDTCNRNRAVLNLEPLPLTNLTPELQAASQGQAIAFPPMALALEPTTAEPLAMIGTTDAPAILRNRHGEGEVILIATGEGAFPAGDSLWSCLRRLVVGESTLECDETARARYRFILTEFGGAHVLHIIDQSAGAPGFEPGELTVSLNAQHLGNPMQIRLVGEAGPLIAKRDAGRIILTLSPDPVTSVECR